PHLAREPSLPRRAVVALPGRSALVNRCFRSSARTRVALPCSGVQGSVPPGANERARGAGGGESSDVALLRAARVAGRAGPFRQRLPLLLLPAGRVCDGSASSSGPR